MRSVGLDLGARHIASCEVVDGVVTRRGSVGRLSELEAILGPETAPAQVAFEASREGWHVHDVLLGWGKKPWMLDTARIRRIGVGHHGRKNDAIDAEAIAMALDAGRFPVAHVLSPERRALRAKLSVRSELVDTRARQVTLLRGLARAPGVLIGTSSTDGFVQKLEGTPLDDATRALMAPLVATLTVVLDVLACPRCGGRMRLVALVTDAASVRPFLRSLGASTDAPARAPPRGPPYWRSRVLRRAAGEVSVG